MSLLTSYLRISTAIWHQTRSLLKQENMKIIRYNNSSRAWSPFDRLSSLHGLVNSAFHSAAACQAATASWTPPLDVYEDDDQIAVDLEAPGLRQEDFNVSLQEGILSISGERTAARGEGDTKSERSYGHFERKVHLPAAVNGEKVTASYKNGVLSVSLPKADEAKPRKVQVETK